MKSIKNDIEIIIWNNIEANVRNNAVVKIDSITWHNILNNIISFNVRNDTWDSIRMNMQERANELIKEQAKPQSR